MTPCIGDGRDSVGGMRKGIRIGYTCKTRMKKLFGNLWVYTLYMTICKPSTTFDPTENSTPALNGWSMHARSHLMSDQYTHGHIYIVHVPYNGWSMHARSHLVLTYSDIPSN